MFSVMIGGAAVSFAVVGPFSSFSTSPSTSNVGTVSLGCSYVFILFPILSPSSPFVGVLKTLVRVRGEPFRLFSSSYATFIPPLIHKRVIKLGWGMLPEKLFST